MTAIVIDLDGTLCNSAHREHHAQNKDWDAFHGALSEDEPHRDVAAVVRNFSVHGIYLLGCTGRNERYRIETERWLLKHRLPLDELLMRPDDDFRPDHELKPFMVEAWHQSSDECEIATAQERILFVLEDRDKVVEAWRNAGFNCWQVRHGGY